MGWMSEARTTTDSGFIYEWASSASVLHRQALPSTSRPLAVLRKCPLYLGFPLAHFVQLQAALGDDAAPVPVL